LALTLAAIRKVDDAAATLEALLEQTTDDAATRLDLAVLLIWQQSHAQALIHLHQAPLALRNTGRARFYQAIAMLDQERE
jgi:hypothetical protein